MKPLFELIRSDAKETGSPRVSLGIKVDIGGRETTCPITGLCDSLGSLEREILSIKEELEGILDRTERIFRGASAGEAVDLGPDMSAEEIWEALSTISDETAFIDAFNGMEESMRKEVADYVLARCNIFSGKGAVFSSLYDNDSGILET